jgi:molybdopterin-binding protein
MAKQERVLSAGDAARELGISLDTLRRWDRQGRIAVTRDSANRRCVAASEIARIRGTDTGGVSARNRLRGTVRSVQVDGLLAQVEIDLIGPSRVVAVITRDAVEALGLRPGVSAAALVKSTSVMVERG